MKNIGYIVFMLVLVVGGMFFLAQDGDEMDAVPVETGNVQTSSDVGSAVDMVEVAIVGTWVSDGDSESVVTYNDSGTFRSLYSDLEIQNGTWEMYTKENTNKGPSGNFIRVIDNLLPEGDNVMEYSVLKITSDTLTLSLIGRGNTLHYTRVVED